MNVQQHKYADSVNMSANIRLIALHLQAQRDVNDIVNELLMSLRFTDSYGCDGECLSHSRLHLISRLLIGESDMPLILTIVVMSHFHDECYPHRRCKYLSFSQ